MAGIWTTCACTPICCNTSSNSNPTPISPTNSTQLPKIQRGLASPHSSLKAHKLPSFSSKSSASASSSAAVGSDGYIEEPATNVKFQASLIIPGSSKTLALLGTGYREKVFAFIGVKVYAAGFFVNPSVINTLTAWKGQSASEIKDNSALFRLIFQAPSEKSLQIVLVRDVDGKTFWDALDGAISPRIKVPTSLDEPALSTFRGIFQERSLNKGTLIFLTWLDPSKMQVSVSSNGMPSGVDATIESANVTSSLFDVFFGDSPVSPSLKDSVASGLSTIL